MVTGSIPPTGIPLPFMSAGSSSLIVFLGAIGILCNISKMSEHSQILNKNKIFDFNFKIMSKSKV